MAPILTDTQINNYISKFKHRLAILSPKSMDKVFLCAMFRSNPKIETSEFFRVFIQIASHRTERVFKSTTQKTLALKLKYFLVMATELDDLV